VAILSKPEFILTVDCKQMSCPLPILKTKNAINGMEVGETMEMIATDPGSVADMDAWARQTGHELVYSEQEDKEYYYYIKKTH